MQGMSSEHYLFANDKTAFRLIGRVDGRPWLQSPLTPHRAARTRSARTCRSPPGTDDAGHGGDPGGVRGYGEPTSAGAWPRSWAPRSAPRHPLAGLDREAIIREGRAAVAAMQARRQARYEQNATRREQAMQLYEAVRTAAYGAPSATRRNSH